jgi:hypothetical protein
VPRTSEAGAAFEEAVRYESPVQTFFRTTTRPVDIAGIAVGEGEKVLMFLGAANHDRRRWERPDEYDITRRTTGHVGRRGGPVISGPSRKAAMLSLFPGPLHEPRRERSVDGVRQPPANRYQAYNFQPLDLPILNAHCPPRCDPFI